MTTIYLYTFCTGSVDSEHSDLYQHFPVLKEKISNIHSEAVGAFKDLSFFYRFNANLANMKILIGEYELKESIDCQQLFDNRPLWGWWWWKPSELKASRCYYGEVGGGYIYLLYDSTKQTAYIYEQNT